MYACLFFILLGFIVCTQISFFIQIIIFPPFYVKFLLFPSFCEVTRKFPILLNFCKVTSINFRNGKEQEKIELRIILRNDWHEKLKTHIFYLGNDTHYFQFRYWIRDLLYSTIWSCIFSSNTTLSHDKMMLKRHHFDVNLVVLLRLLFDQSLFNIWSRSIVR